MQHAIIAIEDQRFYENDGVDLRGIGRALVPGHHRRQARPGRLDDHPAVRQERAEGAGPSARVFQKLREAALAYHLTRKWSKEKILTEYLNSIYFGNGAYGIESAARTYFGAEPDHDGCGERGAARAPRSSSPHEAALLAGDRRLAERATTRSRTRGRRSGGATSCCARCSSRATSRAPSSDASR